MATPIRYPFAQRLDLVERIHDRIVADPYRWLEDADSPATRAWSAAQAELWQAWADSAGAREPLRRRLTDLVPGFTGAPSVVEGRRFWLQRAPGQDHALLLVHDAAGARVLVDPNRLVNPATGEADGTVTLDGWSPSLEGDRLAYQLSQGGDEESSIWVLDVEGGGTIDGPIDRTRYSSISWLPGGQELLYVRRLPPGSVPEGEAQYHRRVYRHRIGRPPEHDEEIFGAGADKTAYFGTETDSAGRWVTVTTSLGTAPRNDVHLRDLADPAAPWRAVLAGRDARAEPSLDRRGSLWLLTDLDAPLGRLCRLTLSDLAAVGPEDWVEVVAEDGEGAVLEGFVLAGEHLVLAWRRHAVSELTIHDRQEGTLLRRVELPGAGSADLTGRPDEGPEVWVGYTDHATPYQVSALDLTTGRLHPAPPPGGDVAPAGRVTAPAPGAARAIERTSRGGAGTGAAPSGIASGQLVAVSADGTELRLTVVSSGGGPGQPRPTVLYGYGGFDVALTPAYSSSVRAWVEAGGNWVVAHLRGGSEEGEAWHRDGMRENKHHVFEDFEAAADLLVAEGWTTPEQLGIFGGSNGGLLVGAALTRSPERYAAVVCSAPLLDMVRYERFGLGATWNDEYGTAEDPVELGWLLDMSPYHHVEPRTAYPAVLFTVFDRDSRVDPLHARKMAAALQWATTSDPSGRPVLLRAEPEVGHGARSVSRTVDLAADELAFLGAQLGLDLPLSTLG